MKIWQYQGFAKPVFRPPDLSMGWFAAWSEPVFKKPPKRDCPELSEPVFRPPDLPFGWFREWEKPRAANALKRQEEFAEPVFVPPSPAYSWFQAWGEPTRKVPGRQDWIAAPVFTPVAIVVPPLGWFAAWPEFIFKTQPKRQDELAAPVFAQPAPAYSWALQWSEPVPRKKPTQDYFAEPVFAQPAPAYSWFQPFAEPIRWKRTNQDWITAPVFTPVSVVIPSFAWFTGWPDAIVRKAQKRQEEISAPVFAQPAPAYSWALPWSEPARKIPPRQSDIAAPVFVPSSPSFSWFGAWSEPVKKRPAALPESGGFTAASFTTVFFLHKGTQVLELLTCTVGSKFSLTGSTASVPSLKAGTKIIN